MTSVLLYTLTKAQNEPLQLSSNMNLAWDNCMYCIYKLIRTLSCVTRNSTAFFPVCLDDPYLMCFDLLGTLCSASKNKHNRREHTYSSIRCCRPERARCWISLICVCLTSLLVHKQPLTSALGTTHWSQGFAGLLFCNIDQWRKSAAHYVRGSTQVSKLCACGCCGLHLNWSSAAAAYLLHTCKYPQCSRALTFERSRADENTRIATWEFTAHLLGYLLLLPQSVSLPCVRGRCIYSQTTCFVLFVWKIV